MPIDRPTAIELVSCVREHLVDKLTPKLQGQEAFHLRVATNALAIVERTLEHGDALDQAELTRLQTLMGGEGNLIDLNRSLAAQIREGKCDFQRDSLLAHLRQTVIDKLRLANPDYMAPRD